MTIPARLEALAYQATAIAYDMQHEPDWAYVQHGSELLGAAGMMREWAHSIKQNSTMTLLALFLACSILPAQIKEDKRLHFVAGGLVGAYVSYRCEIEEIPHPKLWGLAAALIVGVAKEVRDSRQPGNKFDPADALATAAGGAAGVTLVYVVRF